jgi:hypothetical protein
VGTQTAIFCKETLAKPILFVQTARGATGGGVGGEKKERGGTLGAMTQFPARDRWLDPRFDRM